MKKWQKLMAAAAFLIIAGTSAFGAHMYYESRDYKNYLQNQYQKNLYDLINHMNGLEVSLSKEIVASSHKQSSILLGDIWRQASSAHDKINSLPITHRAILNTSKFLSQVSDFSYALLKGNTSGKNLSTGELQNLQKLKDYSGYITLQLREFERQIGDKGIDLNELHKQGSAFLSKAQTNLDVSFQRLSDQIQEYPSLIYDGPFSENVLNIKPKVLNEKEISYDEAEKFVNKVFGPGRILGIKEYSKKTNDKIPVYAMSIKLKGRNAYDINIDISKNGGHIVYLLDSRSVNRIDMNLDQAADTGVKFLKKVGYNMMPNYTLRYDGIAVINYVGLEKDGDKKVMIYPDQIKLKIALDNGDIVGIEASHYLTAHHKRRLDPPKLSLKDAEKILNKKLNVKNIRLTLIPMESLKEILCYEFYGDYNGEKYFIYINAENGSEERILKVVNTENGELTM